MKRAILVGLGTIAGTTAVLGYQPGAVFGASEAAESTTTVTATTVTATTGTTTTAATAQTFTGDSVQTRYGAVQVRATVENGQVTDVTAIAVPANDGHSAQISASVIPTLEDQAVAAQSASIDGVSGASYTSAGFAESLQSALVQAGLA